MPRREIGLMGYLGEALIARWLQERFPAPKFEIVSQIRPMAVPAKGGPYLDFGVLRGTTVQSVFEVKCQDYIFAGGVNKSLKYLWRHRGEAVRFALLDKRRFSGDRNTEAYLVLLVPPNRDGIEEIGRRNLKRVFLFEDILGPSERAPALKPLLPQLHTDARGVLRTLKNPGQGVSLRAPFMIARGGVPLILGA